MSNETDQEIIAYRLFGELFIRIRRQLSIGELEMQSSMLGSVAYVVRAKADGSVFNAVAMVSQVTVLNDKEGPKGLAERLASDLNEKICKEIIKKRNSCRLRQS